MQGCTWAAWLGALGLSLALMACSGSNSPAVAESLAPKAMPPSSSPYPPAQQLSALPQGVLSIGQATLQVAIAEEAQAQAHGLSGQAQLEPGHGLLFLWPAARRLNIWMPEMNFPIDVLFFRSGELKAIFADAQPCPSRLDCPSFGPEEDCDAVLELGAGEAKRLNLAVGQSHQLRR